MERPWPPSPAGAGPPPWPWRAAAPERSRLERFAPAQKAGGAPVTTTAPTPGSDSSRSKISTISPTMPSDRALRRSGSSSVTTATPAWPSSGLISTCTSAILRPPPRRILAARDGSRRPEAGPPGAAGRGRHGGTGAGSALRVAHHGRGAAEERLHIALVGVVGPGLPDGALEA